MPEAVQGACAFVLVVEYLTSFLLQTESPSTIFLFPKKLIITISCIKGIHLVKNIIYRTNIICVHIGLTQKIIVVVIFCKLNIIG
jgi:hypothetical protein